MNASGKQTATKTDNFYSCSFDGVIIHWHSIRNFITPPGSVRHLLSRILLDQYAKQTLQSCAGGSLPTSVVWLRILGANDQDFETLGLSWMIGEDTHSTFRSPLQVLGYPVGKSGVSEVRRQRILSGALTGDLPSSGNSNYTASWGAANTAIRLLRITSHLRFLSIGMNVDAPVSKQRYKDYVSDIAWMRIKFEKLYSDAVDWINSDFAQFASVHLDSGIEATSEIEDAVPGNLSPNAPENPADDFADVDLADERERVSASVVQRLGQRDFRLGLLTAYGTRCPVTGCNVEAALQAAHIVPYSGTRSDRNSNGLPLRADIHILFDLHLLSIDPRTMTVRLARSLLETSYAELEGKPLALPADASSKPGEAALNHHYARFLKIHGA